MIKPTITINGNVISMRNLTGRDWRILGEFMNEDIKPKQSDYIEKHAAFIANFFEGVTADDVLNLPLSDIFPLYSDIQQYFTASISEKLEIISKNVETDGAA